MNYPTKNRKERRENERVDLCDSFCNFHSQVNEILENRKPNTMQSIILPLLKQGVRDVQSVR
jgi:hypothetical protein